VTPAPTLDWQAGRLEAALQALHPGLVVQVVAEDTSTNATLVARGRSPGAPAAACLLVAEHQTAGRGRMGRAWLSARGDSLTFSLALPCAPADWSGLSLAVGVALADALDDAGTAIGLKWPNDLWLRDGPGGRGRKLGGILIETVGSGGAWQCVIGVGLNVRLHAFEGLETGCASLQELAPEAHAPAILHRVAAPLLRAVLRFQREGFGAFAEGFARRDLLCGLPVRTTQAGLPEALAAGVDGDGALLVRDEGQRLHRIVSGEVSVRPAQPAQELA